MNFCWHTWSKWSVPFDTADGYEKVQTRTCDKCNRAQAKKIIQPWNIWFGAAIFKETPK